MAGTNASKGKVQMSTTGPNSKFGIGSLTYAPIRMASTKAVDPNCASCCGAVSTCGCASCATNGSCAAGCGAATKVKKVNI